MAQKKITRRKQSITENDIYIEDDENGTLEITSFNEDGTLKLLSFSTLYHRGIEKALREGWPVVESALEEHGVSCELNMVEVSMTISATKKTSFETAKHLLKLLSVGFAPRSAIKMLKDEMHCEVIEVYPLRGLTCGQCGICKDCGIRKDEFCKRLNRLKGPGLKELSRVTDCSISLNRFTVSSIGPLHGIKSVRMIVLDCFTGKRRPKLHMKTLKANQTGLLETVMKLKNQTGITSIMEAVRFMKTQIICRAPICTSFMEALHRIQDTDVLEMIADKFRSSDSPKVHGDASETLCAIARFAPPELSNKISSPSFVQRLFRHALEDSSRPKSVLVNSLSVCISLLDPRRITFGTYEHINGRQITSGSKGTASPETVVAMLESLGDLLKLLDVSSEDNVLTTYGKLQPPLGKHRLKILEFISVLLRVGSEAAEKELISLGALRRILDLFFKYPFNNLAHHYIENIIVSCLESKNGPLVLHLLCECDLVGKILQAVKNFTLAAHSNKLSVLAEGRSPPRIGNIGHLTRISNKIIQLGNNNSEIQAYLQENSEWTDWYRNVLSKPDAVENVWACWQQCAKDMRQYRRQGKREEFRSSSPPPHSIQSSPPSSPLPRPSLDMRPTIIITGTNYGWHVQACGPSD